ncbi:MAG TPA: ester cyclase [Gaiellaceae bacterium]
MPDNLEENKAIVRRMLEAFNSKKPEIVAELIHPDVKDRSRALGFEKEIREGSPVRRVQTEILREEDAFPDSEFTEDAIVAEGDTVAIRWRMKGTHKGKLLGNAPTGKQVETHGTEIVKIKDGKIVEHIGNDGMDLLDLLFQLDFLDKDVVRKMKTGDKSLGAGHRTAPA